MTRGVIDCSRLLRACGLDDLLTERNERVLHFLSQSPNRTMIEFRRKFEAAAEGIRSAPLQKFREPKIFEKYWRFAETPQPLMEWNFLSHTNPEEAGIFCEAPDHETALITERDVPSLSDEEELPGVFDLQVNLSWWRFAVCAVWAGRIVRNLILLSRGSKYKLLLPGAQPTNERGFAFRNRIDEGGPIGAVLELSEFSDDEIGVFYELCDAAIFGSITCEYGVASAFREFLRSSNIRTLQELGLTFEEAHVVLLAGSTTRSEMDIRLKWDQETEEYSFVCVVENKDIHGFTDPAKTGGIPHKLLNYFYERASTDVQKDLLRLILRAGQCKARDLLVSKLATSYEPLAQHKLLTP